MAQEMRNILRYMAAFGGLAVVFWIMRLAIDQEYLERKHPSPGEWWFRTRYLYRIAMRNANPKSDHMLVDWPAIFQTLKFVSERLEDQQCDGEGVKDIVAIGVGGEKANMGKDITAKADEWRRGYYEVLMTLAKAAEYVDGYVLDKKTEIVFPRDMVVGPSNPQPKPIPFGVSEQPREEDCEFDYFEAADTFYNRILTTKGFNPKEKMEAALRYASFLEFKDRSGAAASTLEWALDLANETCHSTTTNLPYDPKTLLVKNAANPSANQLKVLTAIATYKARNGALDDALSMLVAILRSRAKLLPSRSALEMPRRKTTEKPDSLLSLWQRVQKSLSPPPYPGRFPDGSDPPARDISELCEEAVINAYIGEIMFSKGSHHQAVAWSRESVELSEEQLQKLRDIPVPGSDSILLMSRETRDAESYYRGTWNHCRQCLEVGLSNWQLMAKKMADAQIEEVARKKAEIEERQSKRSWWYLWGTYEPVPEPDRRWEAELKVIDRRLQKVMRMLESATERDDGFLETLFGA